MKMYSLLTLSLLIHLLSASLIHAQAPTSGLVAYWPMNGNLTDAGPNGINGTLFSATPTTNRNNIPNAALNFNNFSSTVSQYATHPVNTNLNFGAAQNFTISFTFFLQSPWVHTGGLYENNMNYNGYGVWIWNLGGPTDYRIQFNFRNNSVGSSTIPLNTWTQVTCVRNGSSLLIYLNGILDATGTVGTQTPSYTYPARFGTMFYQGLTPPEYNGLYGKMDETRIYNRALSAAEVLQLAQFVLPSKLGRFEATSSDRNVQLDWETLSEQNTSHFEIERSTDGQVYTGIGNVHAKGTSASLQAYRFIDQQPMPEQNFYRLKMVDIDRNYTYSRVIVVKRNAIQSAIRIFPNPVNDFLQVSLAHLPSYGTSMSITDAAGRTVWWQANINSTNYSINVASLPKGLYNLSFYNDRENIRTLSFIKQ